MDEKSPRPGELDSRKRDEWVGVKFLLGEVKLLHEKGLIAEDAVSKITEEYTARLDEIERVARFDAAIKAAKDLAVSRPTEATAWAARARELNPDRREGWIIGINLLRRQYRFEQADQLFKEAQTRFPELEQAKAASSLAGKPANTFRPLATVAANTNPGISWASVAGEFLEDHWQKLISGLAVLLIVVSSTVGASLVLGPLLWSPAGKVILAFLFTTLSAGFGIGLAKWGAERAGQMMLGTTLILIPINLMLVGELGLLQSSSPWNLGLVAIDAALLAALSRWVVGSLGFVSARIFTAAFFTIAACNAGATRGMPFESGFPLFLVPSAIFLGAVRSLNGRFRSGRSEDAGEAKSSVHFAYAEFGLLAFGFLATTIRTGAAVLQLAPALYAIPAMLAAIASVATARAVEPIEKDRQRGLLFLEGGLTLSALAFASAFARPPGPSALYSGNTLAVAILGLALYATSLRATRKPAYLYCGFAALLLAYFGAFYFFKDLVRSVEEAARSAMGYDRPLPVPFKAINGLAFNLGLAFLSRFFVNRWSDDRLARHCHYIGLPLSIVACVFSTFEPKAGLICLGGYAVLYALGTRVFHQPRLIYLSCAAVAGSVYLGVSVFASASLGLVSLMASLLGLIFWGAGTLPAMKHAGDSYLTPLIRSARVMSACALAAATIDSIQLETISPLATMAFLLTGLLALLNGIEAPRVPVYLLAIVAFLGSWLGGLHILNGGVASSLFAHGLAIACYTIVLIATAETLRTWRHTSNSTVSFLEAIGWAVPSGVILAWVVAGWNLTDTVTVARTFLVGAVALLWLTRFRLEQVLVYLGLGGLAVWAACLCGLVVLSDPRGIAVAWFGVTSSGVALTFWGVGEWVRRRDRPFYYEPLFLSALILSGLAGLLAFGSWWLDPESYRIGVIATFAATLAFGLVAASTVSPISMALGIASAAGASTLIVLGQGIDPITAARWVAGAFVVEAVLCRGIGWLIRRSDRQSLHVLARSLDLGAAVLAFAALPGGSQSPVVLLGLAILSVLMIGSFPSTAWIYSAFVTFGWAIYLQFLVGSSWEGLLAFVVLVAYLAWIGGVGLSRISPTHRQRLGWPDLAFERPAAHVSMSLGGFAFVIWLKTIVDAGGVWTSRPWLPWSLGFLCLLMLRFQPRGRGWVHAAAGLMGLGFTATLAPVLDPKTWWISAGIARSLFWALAAIVAIRGEHSFRRRLGIARGFDAEVFREWAVAMFGLSALSLIAIVGWGTLFSYESISTLLTAGWADVMLAIGLAAVFVGVEARRLDAEGRWIGWEVVALLAVWWSGVSSSPAPVWLDRNAYLALGTGTFSLGVILVRLFHERRVRRLLEDPVVDPGPESRVGFRRFTSWFLVMLGLATVEFSVFNPGRVAFPSLLLATLALGLAAVLWSKVESTITGGVLWCLTVPVGLILLARMNVDPAPEGATLVVAVGFLAALVSLWVLAGWLRSRLVEKSADPLGNSQVASAFEWVAIVATLPCAFFALISTQVPHVAVSGLILAIAVFHGFVAWRKHSAWPVYVAQGLLLVAYFRVREVLEGSGVADAVILSLFAYLDLGLSEVFGKLKLDHFSKPTMRVSMILPLIPIFQGIRHQRADDADLIVLLATAGFYSLASFRLRSRTSAYAAAVLMNAFLWLAWYRLGWRFAESPQFFLIPVGFSAILFAEVNRNEMSKSIVNGARNLGLVVIYASLTAPIWQTHSFGAWLALLLLSLAGIFVGIGLRVQSFLWLGLVCFVADLIYQLTRIGLDNALARWGVMLSLGVGLILFVAFNEKKRIVSTLREYYDQARTWE